MKVLILENTPWDNTQTQIATMRKDILGKLLSPVLRYDLCCCFIAATILQIVQGYLSENSAIVIAGSWGVGQAPLGNISSHPSTSKSARGACLFHLAGEGEINLAFSTKEISNLST